MHKGKLPQFKRHKASDIKKVQRQRVALQESLCDSCWHSTTVRALFYPIKTLIITMRVCHFCFTHRWEISDHLLYILSIFCISSRSVISKVTCPVTGSISLYRIPAKSNASLSSSCCDRIQLCFGRIQCL